MGLIITKNGANHDHAIIKGQVVLLELMSVISFILKLQGYLDQTYFLPLLIATCMTSYGMDKKHHLLSDDVSRDSPYRFDQCTGALVDSTHDSTISYTTKLNPLFDQFDHM